MAKLLQNRTPAQLAWIIAASNLLVASSFATIFVESYNHPKGHWLSPWTALLSFVLLILGGIMGMFAEAALKNGIASERWSEALVASTRKFFSHPALSAAIVLLIVASFAFLLFFISRHSAAAWIFLFPAMSLTRVKAIFSRPLQNTIVPGTQDPPKPLQSGHWGISSQPSSR